MHVPNEIILQALQDLPRIHLKAARLVDKQWSSCATRFLFDVLYISPHKTNIDVFQSIVLHPVLRGCVKKLVYDGIGFSTKLTYSQYFGRLWKHITGATSGLRSSFDIPDSQISRFTELTKPPTCKRELLRYGWTQQQRFRIAEEECSDFGFIKAGYRKWQEHALHEQECMENGSFVRTLTMGLKRLDHLSIVRLNDGWPDLGYLRDHAQVPAHYHGSPLARSWGFFNATPLDWSWGPAGSRGLDMRQPGYLAFWTITIALSESEKGIRSFGLGSGIAPATFDTRSIATERLMLHGVDAFARLKELRLDIRYDHDASLAPDRYATLSGLRFLLSRICNLEKLELCLTQEDLEPFIHEVPRPLGEWLTYEYIFPKTGVWSHLTTLAIGDMRIRDEELVHLLFARMPGLQHLKIKNMDLLQGTWESVIEVLKFRRLCSFDMKSSYYLYDDLTFDDDASTRQNFLDVIRYVAQRSGDGCFESLERYIVHGLHDLTLRHPSLEDSMPTQDSLDFLWVMYDENSVIRYITDIDFAKLKEDVAKACAKENWKREMAKVTGSRFLFRCSLQKPIARLDCLSCMKAD